MMQSDLWSSLVTSKAGIPPPDVCPGMLAGVQTRRWWLFRRKTTWKSYPNARLEDLLDDKQRERNSAMRAVNVDPAAPFNRESQFFVNSSPVEVGADVTKQVMRMLTPEMEAYSAKVALHFQSDVTESFKGTGCSLDYLVLTDPNLQVFIWGQVPRNIMDPPTKARVHFFFAVMYSNGWTTSIKSVKDYGAQIEIPVPHANINLNVVSSKDNDGTFVYKASTDRFPIAVMIASFGVTQDKEDPSKGRRTTDIEHGVIRSTAGGPALLRAEEDAELPEGVYVQLPAEVSAALVPCASGPTGWQEVAELMALREPMIALDDTMGRFAAVAGQCGIEVGSAGELSRLVKDSEPRHVDIDSAYEPLPQCRHNGGTYLLWRRRQS